jgi:hypothetical protein
VIQFKHMLQFYTIALKRFPPVVPILLKRTETVAAKPFTNGEIAPSSPLTGDCGAEGWAVRSGREGFAGCGYRGP